MHPLVPILQGASSAQIIRRLEHFISGLGTRTAFVRGMVFRFPFRLWVFPLLWLCVPAPAAEFTAAGAESQAVRHNPDLAAARFRIVEARGRLLQSGRRPNPELQVEAEHNAKFREGSFRVGFVQKFPLTAKLRLEKEVSLALVGRAEAEVRMMERGLILNVRQLVVKALALEAQRALRNRQLGYARELAAFAARSSEAGEVSGADAAQFELDAQQISLELLQLQSEKSGVLGELRPLLGLTGQTSVSLRGTLAAPVMPAVGDSLGLRPEYQAALHGEIAAWRSVELEKSRRREDISAGIFAGAERTEDVPDGLRNDGLIGVRVSIPLPFWNKNEGNIQEAAATADRLAAEREALARRIVAETDAVHDRMRALAKLVNDIDSVLLPKAQDLEKRIKDFHTTGQTPLTDVLRARDKRLQLEKTRLDSLRDFHLIRASLGLNLNSGPHE